MPSSVVVRNVSKSFGPKTALSDITFTLGPHTRMGVVGRNGSGKSTLLRILAGIELADAGSIEAMPSSSTIGFLAQEHYRSDESVMSYLSRRAGITDAVVEFEAASSGLVDATNQASERFDVALERFMSLGAADFDARAETVLADLGLDRSRWQVPTTALSGGQMARVSLAAILLSRFDLLLLDEPTNDLDFAGIEKLEQFLVQNDRGVMVVSHDRAFLEKVTTSILEIDQNKHTASEYRGGWLAYLEAQGVARRHAEERYAEYKDKRAALSGRVQQQKQWADQGKSKAKKSDESDKFIRHHNVSMSEKVASKARTTEKALERLEVVEKPWEGWQLNMELPVAPRSGDVVATLSSAIVRQGDFTLGPIDVEINYGDRLAITGPNGAGKTTLLKALLGELPLDSGEQYVGPGVIVGRLDQMRSLFLSDASLVNVFVEASGLLVGDARSLLAKFDLSSDHVNREAISLSPGERTRALLALLMAKECNCLVLDEPTNHLDIEAIEQLEQALSSYSGTVLLVTHDRRLLEQVEITRTVSL